MYLLMISRVVLFSSALDKSQTILALDEPTVIYLYISNFDQLCRANGANRTEQCSRVNRPGITVHQTATVSERVVPSGIPLRMGPPQI